VSGGIVTRFPREGSCGQVPQKVEPEGVGLRKCPRHGEALGKDWCCEKCLAEIYGEAEVRLDYGTLTETMERLRALENRLELHIRGEL
jgi:hypothetical protein